MPGSSNNTLHLKEIVLKGSDGYEKRIDGRSLEDPAKLANNALFTIKQGVSHTLGFKFGVSNGVSRLQYVCSYAREGSEVRVISFEMGNYAANTSDAPFHTFQGPEQEVRDDASERGTYTATSQFMDDNNQALLMFMWCFNIGTDWA
ncbi:hypothetical protein TWF694_004982 [Orbilia ellipsospora]|uniref:Uncharacterized protein n=1 Tax=Orbilia ellipsospora TaxID=2528407 RepID=A0AAV9WUD2_9PEZI